MKKTALFTLIIVLIASFTMFLFTACDNGTTGGGNGGTTGENNGGTTGGDGGTTKVPDPVIGTEGVKYSPNWDYSGYVATGLEDSVTVKDIVISSEYEGKPVIGIGPWAFEGNSQIESVTIPFSVEGIGEYAFSGCENLKTVKIGEGVEAINSCAFEDCTNLESVTLPDSMTYIGDSAFEGCQAIKSIILPENLETLADRAFMDCKALSSVAIYENVKRMGNRVFSDCDKLVYNEYQNGLYLGNDGNKYAVLMGVKDDSVTEFTVHSSTKTIGSIAFGGCVSLTGVNLPNGLKAICNSAFYNCSALEQITLPAGVEDIGADVFSGCDVIVIYCKSAKKTDWGTSWNGGYPVIWDCDNNDRDEYGYAYTTVNGIRYIIDDEKPYLNMVISLSGSELVIPSKVNYKNKDYTIYGIDYEAFRGCTQLIKVTIPSTVKVIAEAAFKECENLKEVVLNNGLQKIATDAFSECHYLEKITIPGSVTEVGYGAFERCYSLTINCEVSAQPAGWSSSWNVSNRPVNWGYRG